MFRWSFALKQGFAHGKQLHDFLVNKAKQIHSLEEITAEKLDNADIAIVVFDFDGVLASHDEMPSQAVVDWLRQLCVAIGEHRIALLSNKPKPERIAFFTKHFPSIHFVREVKKKPYPDGIIEIAQYRGVPPHRVVLVDDRLLTGMLATCLAYSQGWYFVRPRRNFWRHPLKESFFSLLRGVERGLFRWL